MEVIVWKSLIPLHAKMLKKNVEKNIDMYLFFIWFLYTEMECIVNSLRPILQIMACRLAGAKPLSEPMLVYCQLEP